MQRSTLKRPGSPPDLQRAKALRPTLNPTVRPKGGSPLLIVFPDDDCRLYNPDQSRFYETSPDFSRYRFLGNSGKWFLVVDSQSDLYIIDVFGEEERIRLPPLESLSIKGGFHSLKRLGDKEFHERLFKNDLSSGSLRSAEDLRGVLWVDEKKGDYVVVWRFDGCYDGCYYVGFCKKGDDHYREISTQIRVRRELKGLSDMVLKGYRLYVLTTRDYIRLLDFSGQDGFEDVSERHMYRMCPGRDEFERLRANKMTDDKNIAVTTSGEVLLVHTNAYESRTSAGDRMFSLYKRDPKYPDLNSCKDIVKVDSLGEEALLLDLGITVPADHTLGIEPNSIYFTRNDRVYHRNVSCLDICVYNLATKTIKRFPNLYNLNLKDARWFLLSS